MTCSGADEYLQAPIQPATGWIVLILSSFDASSCDSLKPSALAPCAAPHPRKAATAHCASILRPLAVIITNVALRVFNHLPALGCDLLRGGRHCIQNSRRIRTNLRRVEIKQHLVTQPDVEIAATNGRGELAGRRHLRVHCRLGQLAWRPVGCEVPPYIYARNSTARGRLIWSATRNDKPAHSNSGRKNPPPARMVSDIGSGCLPLQQSSQPPNSVGGVRTANARSR